MMAPFAAPAESLVMSQSKALKTNREGTKNATG